MKALDRIYLHGDMLVRGDLNREANFTRGIELSGLRYLNASESHLLDMQREFTAILKMLKQDTSLQIQWRTGHDYHKPLEDYRRRTGQVQNAWCRHERQTRHAHYLKATEEGKLRREETILYLTHRAAYQPARGGTGRQEQQWQSRLHAAGAWFQSPLGQLADSARRLGGEARPLDKAELFGRYFHCFNPSSPERDPDFLWQRYDPKQSLLENCVCGEFLPLQNGGDSFFHYDAHYHAALVLKSPPQSTIMGMMTMLTHLPLRGFRMTMHIVPVDVGRELENEQKSSRKLRKAYRQSGDPEYASLLGLKEARIDAMVKGELQPFGMQMIFQLRALDKEQLEYELQTLKAGIDRFYGARSHSPALPTSLRDYFLAGLPGNPRPVEEFYHDIEQTNLSHLLPPGGAAAGSLENPAAIYHDWSDQLMAVRCFNNGNPMHLTVVGGTGSGKSMFMMGFLTQTMDEFDFTVIVDDGASYISYAPLEEEGVEPLVIDRNGQQTLNYLDTQGLPFTPEMQADFLAVAKLMTGSKTDRFQEAVLEQAVRKFYRHWYRLWRDRNPERHQQVLNEAGLLEAYRKEHSLRAETTVLFAEFQHWKKEHPERVREWQKAPSTTKTDDNVIAELGFAFLRADEMPTHSDWQGWLEREASTAREDAEVLRRLAVCFKSYRRDSGRCGCLLDGTNSIRFDRRLVYIELGKVREAAGGRSDGKKDRELEQLATFILTNKIRNEIVRRPRSQKKRVVFEEVGSFLTLPDGPDIVREFMQTMRKYQCMVVTVAQQLGTLDDGVAKTIRGNVSQAVFLKSRDPDDTGILQRTFGLPRSTVEMMGQFEDPSKEKGAAFVHWSKTGPRAEIRVGWNLASPEMLMVGTTSGSDYERRLALQAGYDSVFEAVVAEAEEF